MNLEKPKRLIIGTEGVRISSKCFISHMPWKQTMHCLLLALIVYEFSLRREQLVYPPYLMMKQIPEYGLKTVETAVPCPSEHNLCLSSVFVLSGLYRSKDISM